MGSQRVKRKGQELLKTSRKKEIMFAEDVSQKISQISLLHSGF